MNKSNNTLFLHKMKWLTATIFLIVSGFSLASAEPTKPKAPFKVLFSNDATNVTTCVSPYHQKGQHFESQMLQATVDETAGTGIEVHMLQPASTWVPWWQSKVYSMQEHYDWWQSRYGNKPDMDWNEYILHGGDVTQLFVDRCRQHNLTPFVSLRLNDGHFLECADIPNNTKGPHCICKFYAEHPEYRIGPDPKNWDDHVQNWAIPEVREYKFKLIREICENYDIDGFELDYMRHTSFFQLDKTTVQQRKEIMTEFVRDARKLLDQTAKPNQHRWLCVRVPCYLLLHDRLGIDLKAMTQAGVDMVNLSPFFFAVHDADVGPIVQMIPDTPVYLEMCHTTYTGKTVAKGYDNFTFRRTTDNQYYTAAHLAYARGAAGISTFNFVYYREHGNGERGPFNEPPFHIYKHIGDKQWVARQPQHYVLAKTWLSKYQDTMPLMFESPGQTKTVSMDMSPPTGGWKQAGKLRIQAEKDLGDSVWQASANGVSLKPAKDLSEPYSNPYSPLLGDASIHRGWMVPAEILKDGFNTFEFTMSTGDETKINFIDLAIQ